MTDIFQISRVLGLSALAFACAIALTPAMTYFLYKWRLGKQIRTEGAPVFASLHQKKAGTPTMGGIMVWLTVLLLAAIFWILPKLGIAPLIKYNFLTRPQTLLPLGALVASALVGLADDLLGVLHIGPKGGGLRMRHRIFIYTAIAAVGAWWFYAKLGRDIVHIPFVGDFHLGIWYILVFVFVLVSTAFSVN